MGCFEEIKEPYSFKDYSKHIKRYAYFFEGDKMVICEILGVYLVDFKNNEGGEMSGKKKILT